MHSFSVRLGQQLGRGECARRTRLICVVLLALGVAGCGEDADSLRDRAERFKDQAREQSTA